VGDVRLSALATLGAAVIVITGSIFAVWLSGRQQRSAQTREFTERRATQRAQWDEERTRADRAAEVDACVRFDAAVVLAIGQVERVARLAGHPRLRRRLLGRDWARQWERSVQAAIADIALPYCAVRLGARPAVRGAVETVMAEFVTVGGAVSSISKCTLPPLLSHWVRCSWRKRMADAIEQLQAARVGLMSALESAEPGVGEGMRRSPTRPPTPTATST